MDWLNKEQNKSSGNWGLEEYPALTGLAVRSFLGHPSVQVPEKYKKTIDSGLGFIRSKVQSDGGIYGKGLASYNTSISMMAMMQAKKDEDAIKTLMNIYGTLGDNKGFKEMKALLSE